MKQTEPTRRRFARGRDFLIILGIFAVAAAVILIQRLAAGSGNRAEALIYYDSSLVQTVELSSAEDAIFPVPGQPDVLLQIKDGAICFYSSTCRDKICIHAGDLRWPGQAAACLPNKVVVRIIATKDDNSGLPDTYVR